MRNSYVPWAVIFCGRWCYVGCGVPEHGQTTHTMLRPISMQCCTQARSALAAVMSCTEFICGRVFFLFNLSVSFINYFSFFFSFFLSFSFSSSYSSPLTISSPVFLFSGFFSVLFVYFLVFTSVIFLFLSLRCNSLISVY